MTIWCTSDLATLVQDLLRIGKILMWLNRQYPTLPKSRNLKLFQWSLPSPTKSRNIDDDLMHLRPSNIGPGPAQNRQNFDVTSAVSDLAEISKYQVSLFHSNVPPETKAEIIDTDFMHLRPNSTGPRAGRIRQNFDVTCLAKIWLSRKVKISSESVSMIITIPN